MSQPDPLHLRDAQQRLEALGDIPTRDELALLWFNGEIDFEAYAALMNQFYPMTVAEDEAARVKPYQSYWSAIIAKREAERDAAKGGGR